MAAAVFLILATVVASVEPRRRTKALIYGLAIVSVLVRFRAVMKLGLVS